MKTILYVVHAIISLVIIFGDTNNLFAGVFFLCSAIGLGIIRKKEMKMRKFLIGMLVFVLFGTALGGLSAVLQHVYDINIPTVITFGIMFIFYLVYNSMRNKKQATE